MSVRKRITRARPQGQPVGVADGDGARQHLAEEQYEQERGHGRQPDPPYPAADAHAGADRHRHGGDIGQAVAQQYGGYGAVKAVQHLHRHGGRALAVVRGGLYAQAVALGVGALCGGEQRREGQQGHKAYDIAAHFSAPPSPESGPGSGRTRQTSFTMRLSFISLTVTESRP